MDSRDMDRIWTLLSKCRLGDKHLEDGGLKQAWALVMEPYEYSDVKQAVAAHFRVSKFWPDVGEVTQYLPAVPTPKDLREQERIAKNLERSLRSMERAMKDRAQKSKEVTSE